MKGFIWCARTHTHTFSVPLPSFTFVYIICLCVFYPFHRIQHLNILICYSVSIPCFIYVRIRFFSFPFRISVFRDFLGAGKHGMCVTPSLWGFFSRLFWASFWGSTKMPPSRNLFKRLLGGCRVVPSMGRGPMPNGKTWWLRRFRNLGEQRHVK